MHSLLLSLENACRLPQFSWVLQWSVLLFLQDHKLPKNNFVGATILNTDLRKTSFSDHPEMRWTDEQAHMETPSLIHSELSDTKTSVKIGVSVLRLKFFNPTKWMHLRNLKYAVHLEKVRQNSHRVKGFTWCRRLTEGLFHHSFIRV